MKSTTLSLKSRYTLRRIGIILFLTMAFFPPWNDQLVCIDFLNGKVRIVEQYFWGYYFLPLAPAAFNDYLSRSNKILVPCGDGTGTYAKDRLSLNFRLLSVQSILLLIFLFSFKKVLRKKAQH